jgi:NodT family efflux transporter outer membrane factor (OMF) lipoprotein
MKKTNLWVLASALTLFPGASAPVWAQQETPTPATTFFGVLNDTTLDRLLAEAVAGNLELQAAEASVDGAGAVRAEGVLNLAPVVTARGGFTRQRLASSTFPTLDGAGFPDQNLWDAGVNTSWEVDVFGRLRNTLSARNALEDAASENVLDVRIAVAADVAQAYFDVRGTQGQLAVARRNAENQRRTLELTQQRLDAGQGNAFDVERARTQLNLTLAAIPSLERRLADAQYHVAVLLGRSPGELAAELDKEGRLPDLPAVLPVPAADRVARDRPDVVRSQWEWAASSAMVGAARADYLPRLSLTGGIGYTASALDSFGNTGTFGYSFGPVITWPLFDLGRVKARVDAARAREAEARARYNHAVLRAAEQLESAAMRYRTERTRLDYLVEAAAASERAAELAQDRYRGGIADFFEVLDAERTLLAAQDQLAQVRTDASHAYVALFEAIGER